MSLQDLTSIKRALLEEHKKLEVPNPESYREGILTGINVALMRIERMIEEEEEHLVRYYDEE
jgi:hypothetical protein